MESSVPSLEDNAPYADRRAYPRVPVALPAFLQANGERHPAQILDLSSGGAKVNCPAGLPAGTTVIVDCGTLARPALVRWQNGALLGLSFETELDPKEVSALMDRSKALDAWMNRPEPATRSKE